MLPDGGPPPRLEVLDPPGSQIGLRYAQGIDLRVRLVLDDAARTPVPKQIVRFAIFGDPAGSTLATDRGVTDDAGVASVRLQAGSEESAFRVRASGPTAGTPPVEFGVAVSRLEFVHLDVPLTWEGAARLRAMLHTSPTCAELGPAQAPPPFREQAQAGEEATLKLMNLLQRDYAIAARAEDESGRPLAWGCVDVGQALVPPGTTLTVPVPLAGVEPSVPGRYELVTALTLPDAAVEARTGAWDELARCAQAPAQGLLDEIAAAVPAAVKAAIAARRGPADAMGCRPPMAGAQASLDASLQALLTPAGSPGRELPEIAADVLAMARAAELTSILVVTAGGPETLVGEHALESLTLKAAPGRSVSYDVPAAGLPLVVARNVAVTAAGPKLTIGAHAFTLGLPRFLERAVTDVAIAPRLPAVMPPTAEGLMTAVVAAAARSGTTGCAAVEDLICTTTGTTGCAGAVAPACTAGVGHLATALEVAFDWASGEDLTLSGAATIKTVTQELEADTLDPGSWTTPLAESAPFTGRRIVP